ncbi:alpha/beta-hydrolase [Fistulina hepatica ATCC 64428]|uniref:Alpha/beta-hydrolase n=1 Tax=Fistulina hepatica ATCC 64428 TaxID=1128425 RepID=A0A0D7ADB9_9AGAR|nr:alpha/beta-hydrolase [Fistulina hepatica ATCC 64428]
MPSVKIKSAGGSLHINYTVSTPTETSAKAIAKDLPVVIFLHPVYIGQDFFHPQFADPQLRRFNLIALDQRGHGETTGKMVDKHTSVEAADDLAKFMEVLKLPPCHLVGLSMGACVALSTAIQHPQKVLSVTMISPLPLEEPADVIQGRQEIYDCWAEGFRDLGELDHEAMKDAIYGSCQLGFNSTDSSLINALVNCTYPQALRNWNPEMFPQLHAVTVGFFAERRAHSRSTLEKIQCPMTIIYCGGDIAYPLEQAEELQMHLREAGVDVVLKVVKDAVHFGSVTHPKEINKICHDFILSLAAPLQPAVPDQVTSPFLENLVRYGLTEEESDEEYFV